MLRWMVLTTLLLSAVPATAASLVCTAEGARVLGTDARHLELALDGRLLRFRNPTAWAKAADATGGAAAAAAASAAQTEADRICAARLGMVAIVLPAPKPSPDEATRGHGTSMVQLRALAQALHNPFAEPGQPGRFGGDDLSDLEVGELFEDEEVELEAVDPDDAADPVLPDEPAQPGEEAAAPADSVQPDPDLDAPGGYSNAAADAPPHCQSSVHPSPPTAAGLAALLVLACTRRRRGGL